MRGGLLPILEAEESETGLGGLEFLAAREYACLFELAWPTATPESEDEYLERDNREIISKLDQALESGKKKVTLYFIPGRLSELEALLSRRPGFKLARKDWLPVWEVGD